MTKQEFAQQIKTQYPAYKDVPDEELANKILIKYPQYLSKIDKTTAEQTIPDNNLVTKQPNGLYKTNYGEVTKQALGASANTVYQSGKNVLSGITQAILHPIKTVESLSKIASGAGTGGKELDWEKFAKINPDIPPEQITKMKEANIQNVQAFQNTVQAVKDRYGGWKQLGNTITTDPVGFFLDVSMLGEGAGTLLKTAGEASKISELSKVGEIVKNIGETTNPIRQATNLVSKGANALGVPEVVKNIYDKMVPMPTKENVLGRITQETNPYKLGLADEALSTIDPSKVKTFKDAANILSDSAAKDLKQVTAKASIYPETYKPADLTKSFTPESGGRTAKINYTTEAIKGLNELYKSVKDPESLAKIKDIENKFKTEGLTSNELNDLAKQYGSEFSSKAFSKVTGEPLTSTNAQAFENIRKGVKENARGTIPGSDMQKLDELASAKIETSKIMQDLDTTAQEALNKMKQAGVGTKLGSAAGKLIEFVTNGGVKAFIKQLGLGMPGAKYDNILELQGQLQKNLEILDKINNAKPAELINLMNNEKFVKSLEGLYYTSKTTQSSQGNVQ